MDINIILINRKALKGYRFQWMILDQQISSLKSVTSSTNLAQHYTDICRILISLYQLLFFLIYLLLFFRISSLFFFLISVNFSSFLSLNFFHSLSFPLLSSPVVASLYSYLIQREWSRHLSRLLRGPIRETPKRENW